MPTTSLKSAAKHLKAALESGNEDDITKYSGAVLYTGVHGGMKAKAGEACDEDCCDEVEECVEAIKQFQTNHDKPNGLMQAGVGAWGPGLQLVLQIALQFLQKYLQDNK